MGEPGWPDFAFSTASTASIASVSMASLSSAGETAVRVSGMGNPPGLGGAERDGGGAEECRAVVEHEVDGHRGDERRHAALGHIGAGEPSVGEPRGEPGSDPAG